MPNPAISDVHVNRPLTNISIAYLQKAENFIATRVFPNVPVEKQADMYYTYDRRDWFRDEAQVRAPGSESAGGGYRVDPNNTYYCPVYAYHKDVDDQTRSNADQPLNMDRDATEFVTQKLALRREKQFVDRYFKAGVWTTQLSGVAGAPGANQFKQWDVAGSTPIQDVKAIRLRIAQMTGFMPNKLVLGPEVFNKLSDHADFVDRIKYGASAGAPAVVTQQIMAQIFGIDEVLVPWGVIDNSAEGAAAAQYAFVFGKNAMLVYAAPNPGLLVPSAGYTFSWTGYTGAATQGNRISRFRMEHLKADRVEGEMAFDNKVVAADLGAYLDGCIG